MIYFLSNIDSENRYDPEVFINEGVEYAELYIRGTAREPPDFVVSEVIKTINY